MTTATAAPRTPEAMLALTLARLQAGTADPQHALTVAGLWVEKWGRLVEREAAGEKLDGRASIYTGETYAEAHARWDTYRGLLVDHLRSPDGGGR